MLEQWQLWLIAGIILCAMEALTTTFYLFLFGVAALIAALCAFLGLGATMQWLVFLFSGFLLIFYARPFFVRLTAGKKAPIGMERLIGEKGIVIKAIDANDGGRVSMKKEEWAAFSKDGAYIEEGAGVRVVGVEGVHLIVERDKEV